MTDSRKGYVRMRTLQAVVLLIFGVIILRLAYIQLFDSRYDDLARANVLRRVQLRRKRRQSADRRRRGGGRDGGAGLAAGEGLDNPADRRADGTDD